MTSHHCLCVLFTKIKSPGGFVLSCVCVCVCMRTLSHIRLFYDPMDHSPPGTSVRGIFQGKISSVSSVTQSCLTDFATPGTAGCQAFLPISNSWSFTQTHVHWVSDVIQPISSCVIPFSSCLQYFSASSSLQMSQFFTSSGQSIGISASTSTLPMNAEDWFPLGWTGWSPLQSKRLSRIFSNTTIQKH